MTISITADPTLSWILIAGAALCGGFVNAVAGGGTLITFPTLTFLGIPAVSANITNTIALCPGYFGGTWAQRKDLKGQRKRLWWLIPIGVIGGLIGGYLLQHTGEKLFRELVPWLILFASLTLALQGFIKNRLTKFTSGENRRNKGQAIPAFLTLPATVYGGYFGAGLGVILMAFLGLTIKDNLTRINALKQAVSLATNVAAAVFFLFSGLVEWKVAAIMAVGALLGGFLGGKLAGKINPNILRWIIVGLGATISVILYLKQ
jgi:uncharacterized membrane protein YfcA